MKSAMRLDHPVMRQHSAHLSMAHRPVNITESALPRLAILFPSAIYL